MAAKRQPDLPHFQLSVTKNQESEVERTINDLNNQLGGIGVTFQYLKKYDKKYLVIQLDNNKIIKVQKILNMPKPGRPKKDIPIATILQMQEQGISNVEIMRQLEIKRPTFYMKLKKYRESQESK